MRTQVKKWGNSASVRIPSAIMEAAHLSLEQAVEIREIDGRVIIEAIPEPAYDLATLLAGITPANLHSEMNTGGPVGNEVW